MKLRFVEREIHTPVDCMTPDIVQVRKVKILQYWENHNPFSTFDTLGKWVDVPLEVEEKNDG
jgi:hypothetical protein